MRRDPVLIRKLMLDLEDSEGPMTDEHQAEGWSRSQVAYHLAQMLKAGFVEGPEPTYCLENATSIPDAVLVLRLTPEGHDFIDAIRSNSVWEKTLERVTKVGGSVTMAVLKETAVAASRQVLGL